MLFSQANPRTVQAYVSTVVHVSEMGSFIITRIVEIFKLLFYRVLLHQGSLNKETRRTLEIQLQKDSNAFVLLH